MRIGFFTEGNWEGEVPRNHPNMRNDMAWMHSLNTHHHPIVHLPSMKDNEYDVGIMIIPKKRKQLLDLPILQEYKRVCKKVTVMQESYYNYWQDSEIVEQIWYYNFLVEMDLIFCHNEVDLKYYRGLTGRKCEIMPTLMITDFIKTSSEKTESVMMGGNLVKDYGGIDSYMVAREITDNIWSITTGRMKEEERQMDINHLGWVVWKDWIYELSKHKYGVQLGTAAAGTFNLNCAYLGIPCVGYNNVNTQRCHPNLSVDVGDVERAKTLMKKLKEDTDFYDECSKTAIKKYNECFDEKVYIYTMKKVISND